MKILGLTGSIALLAFATGCASSKVTMTDAPDGLYVRAAEGAPGYTMKLRSPDGSPLQKIPIQEYDGFIPQHVTVIPRPEACIIQITGQGSGNWMDQVIVLIVNHRPYLPPRKSAAQPAVAGKSPGSPATIFLAVASVPEAEVIAAAMRKRYFLPPEAN